MDGKLWLELLGYVASVLVAVSLMMSRIVRLRVINLVGSLAFTLYGALIGAYPVAAVNGFIVVINLFYLWKMLRAREYFRILVIEPDSEYLRYFLAVHAGDVRRFLPGFAHAPERGEMTLFVLRDLVPAGLFIGEPRGDGCLWVRLDYVIPAYRDFKIGRYLYGERADFFRERGIHTIVSPAGTAGHAEYLRRMGFTRDESSGAEGVYRLRVG
ncbi:YgjV family protein [Longimicrobium sp.]|uniref:YgjV family protein n=1 Tax=Longimicrobium sp. TaxID=2029185 RepID=UPI002CBDFB7D|nr:YgjV family protein [Longimicrobium sp.]HSU16977.1 YgjV family protein [Longimicrobium sp.]